MKPGPTEARQRATGAKESRMLHKEEIKKMAKRHGVILLGCSFGHARISFDEFCFMVDRYCAKRNDDYLPSDKFVSLYGGIFVL